MISEQGPQPEGQEEVDPINHGDRYDLSGDFRGAVINIKSTIVGAAEIKDIEDLPPEPGDPPFKGLQYFDEKDAGSFFGRELLTARIVGRLQRTRFLAVIGASGSGKSSLVRAGIVPALRSGQRLADGGMPPKDSGQWAFCIFTPSAHPLEALAATLLADSDSTSALVALQGELAKEPRTLTLAARRYLARHAQTHLLLVIDQFEEVFTLCRHPDEREAFINNLLKAVSSDEEQPITIIIALRADYYAQVAQHDQLREIVSQYQEFIGAMNRDDLVRAIDQPLALGGWKIQEGLVEVILDDIGYEPGALPLLSHALLETWQRRRGRTLTLSGYTESGGVRGAIAQTAETVFRQNLSPEQQPVARMIFIHMAEVSEDSLDTRRRAAYSELITRSTDELVIEAVIRILSDARLVITDTVEPGDEKVVEVAHEALIREWPTLRQWLAEDRDGLMLHRQMTEDTNDWIKLNREPGVLYRGTRLQNALEWAQKNPDMLSLIEQEFLDTSHKVAAEEAAQARKLAQAKRLQRVMVAVSLVLIIFAGFLAYQYIYLKEPVKMHGLYNIAIAEIGSINPDGSVASKPDPASQQLTAEIFNTLQTQLGQNGNILIWHDSPDLERQNVKIGTVNGVDSGQRATAVIELATRLNADMVIYGAIDKQQNPAQLVLQFYLAPRPDYNYEDIQGGFQLGSPLQVTNLSASDLQGELSSQVGTLAWIALGLSEAQLGHSLEALEAFLKADQLTPGSAMLKFFIGREYLFLVDRDPVLEFARDTFEQQAEDTFKSSIDLDKSYARPYIGLGSVYFKRAQRLIDESQAATSGEVQTSSTFTQALQLTEQAIGAYSQVLGMKIDPATYGVPLESVARLGLGNSYRLKGEILFRMGEHSQALGLIDQAIQEVENTIQPFKDAKQARYLTQSFEYLGSAYQWRAYILEVSQDFDVSLAAYQKAADYFDQCIAQGASTSDLIIKNEIVANICQPGRAKIQDILDNSSGGHG